jgi:hypothetical protein
MKRSAALIWLLAAVMVGLVAPPASAAPYCGIRWGSLPEGVDTMSTGQLVDVRAGRHRCFDRLVLDVRGDVSGYAVHYVDQVTMDASGERVPLRGGARLEVVSRVPAYDESGNSTYVPASRSNLVNVNGFRTFRQVSWAGTFEGQTTIGLGVRARLPFRVFLLDGPGDRSRMVVDVAHRW